MASVRYPSIPVNYHGTIHHVFGIPNDYDAVQRRCVYRDATSQLAKQGFKMNEKVVLVWTGADGGMKVEAPSSVRGIQESAELLDIWRKLTS